jgi:hypothetical protein
MAKAKIKQVGGTVVTFEAIDDIPKPLLATFRETERCCELQCSSICNRLHASSLQPSQDIDGQRDDCFAKGYPIYLALLDKSHI